MADVSQIKLPNGTTYTLKDDGALQLTGGNVTGPVSFGDSVSIDDLNAGQLVVSGSASFANNVIADTFTGKATAVADAGNNTAITIQYSGSGLSSSSWIAAWNGYKIGAISPANITGIGTTHKFVVPRVAKTANTIPGKNLGLVEEFTAGDSYGLPSNHYYYILSAQGNDTAYSVQLALGETVNAVYYRRYASSSWGSWASLINTNTTYSAGTGLSLSSTTFSVKLGYTTSGNNRAVQADSNGNLYVTQKDDNSNTTYTLSGALSSHKFTSTLTAGGSGSGTSTSEITFAAGSNVTLTDDTTNKKITIAATDTTYSSKAAASGGTDVSLVTTGEKYTWNSKTSNTGTITSVKTTAGAHTAINTTSGAVSFNVPTTAAHVGIKFGYTTSGNNRAVLQDSSGNLYVTQKDTNTDISTLTLAEDTGTSAITLAHGGKYKLTAGTKTVIFTMPASGNTDTKVAITAVTPASETTNYVLTHTSTSGTTGVEAHAYNRYWYKQGSTSVNGYVYAGLGNNIATGTANNSQGYVRLYGPNTGYGNITYANATANSTHTLPSTGGTILNTGTTSFTQSLTSGTKVGTIKINGTETILYAPTNTNTTYSAGTGLSLSSTTFSLATSGVTAGSYGAVNNTETTLSGHSTIYELGITVDKYGRVTDVKAKPKNIFSGDILCAHAASGTSTTIPTSTITQIPLTQALVNRNYHSNLSLASNRIAIANAGTYRITGSIYITTTAAASVGVYIMKSSGAFSSATEIASSYIYIGVASSNSINVTKIIEATAGTYIYLGGRSSKGGTVASGNAATYLEVEELRF